MLVPKIFSNEKELSLYPRVSCKLCLFDILEQEPWKEETIETPAKIKALYYEKNLHRLDYYNTHNTRITQRQPLYLIFDFNLCMPLEAYICYRHAVPIGPNKKYTAQYISYHAGRYFDFCLKVITKNNLASTIPYSGRTQFYALLGPAVDNYYELITLSLIRVNKDNMHFGVYARRHSVNEYILDVCAQVKLNNNHTCKKVVE